MVHTCLYSWPSKAQFDSYNVCTTHVCERFRWRILCSFWSRSCIVHNISNDLYCIILVMFCFQLLFIIWCFNWSATYPCKHLHVLYFFDMNWSMHLNTNFCIETFLKKNIKLGVSCFPCPALLESCSGLQGIVWQDTLWPSAVLHYIPVHYSFIGLQSNLTIPFISFICIIFSTGGCNFRYERPLTLGCRHMSTPCKSLWLVPPLSVQNWNCVSSNQLFYFYVF